MILVSRAATESHLERLRRYESPNVTYMDPERRWPIVWERAQDCWVWDADGKRYLDLTAAFGVAALGHSHPKIVEAAQNQVAKLPHAMGDVHPHPLKGALAEKLSAITYERWSMGQDSGRTIFGSSGFEAVEAALKTARLATGRSRIIAFEGGYHGLGYGALNATHRDLFRSPFQSQIAEFAEFVAFPETEETASQVLEHVERILSAQSIGAALIEPIQARGGIRIPASGFLGALKETLNAAGALLILDEIYTGFGRTGKWFGCDWEAVQPDIICLGKALTGGFPLSATVARSDLMEAAWPPSHGEAIHTSTFLGNPVGCSMAVEQIAQLTDGPWIERSQNIGDWFQTALRASPIAANAPHRVRGRGLMIGVDFRAEDSEAGSQRCLHLMHRGLDEGLILLPEGERADVLGFTPPLTITKDALAEALTVLERLDHAP